MRTCSPYGERDRAPGTVQLLGDLDPARRSADDEDTTVGQLARVAVVRRGERSDPGGQAVAQRGHVGYGGGARGGHHRACMPGVLIGLHHIPALDRPHRYHGGVGPHRRRDVLRVVRDQLRCLRCGEVAVGVIAAVGEAR